MYCMDIHRVCVFMCGQAGVRAPLMLQCSCSSKNCRLHFFGYPSVIPRLQRFHASVNLTYMLFFAHNSLLRYPIVARFGYISATFSIDLRLLISRFCSVTLLVQFGHYSVKTMSQQFGFTSWITIPFHSGRFSFKTSGIIR